jgi:hypothetical protein
MEFIISEKALNLIMIKLAELPYSEVSHLFDEVKASVKPVGVEGK